MVGYQTTPQDVRSLYGGAVNAQIPSEFADISVIRQIPDNQEVFSHAQTDRSLLIELLELHNDTTPHRTPAAFHFATIARDASAVSHQLHHTSMQPPTEYPLLLRDDPQLTVSIAYGVHTVSKYRDDESRANLVNVFVACVRLPRATTDLLVVFNDPITLHPESSSARSGSRVAEDGDNGIASRASVWKRALNTLRIIDWSLLG